MAAEPLAYNTIEVLARALMAQCAPATGHRSSGVVTVTAGPAGVLPCNSYLAPLVHGQLRDDLLFKVAQDPTTLDSPGAEGDWVFTAAQARAIPIVSNVGGARHNQIVGTEFRFLPTVAGFTAGVLTTAATAGDNTGLIKQVEFFEELALPDVQDDTFRARLHSMPALMVNWTETAAIEGLSSGARRGSTRAGRKVTVTRETFDLVIFASDMGSDEARHNSGLIALQAITRLISDRQINIDGEALSTYGGGVEVVHRRRIFRSPTLYIYALTVRLDATIEPIDERVFGPWELTHIEGTLPGGVAPQPTGRLKNIDVDEDMTP